MVRGPARSRGEGRSRGPPARPPRAFLPPPMYTLVQRSQPDGGSCLKAEHTLTGGAAAAAAGRGPARERSGPMPAPPGREGIPPRGPNRRILRGARGVSWRAGRRPRSGVLLLISVPATPSRGPCGQGIPHTLPTALHRHPAGEAVRRSFLVASRQLGRGTPVGRVSLGNSDRVSSARLSGPTRRPRAPRVPSEPASTCQDEGWRIRGSRTPSIPLLRHSICSSPAIVGEGPRHRGPRQSGQPEAPGGEHGTRAEGAPASLGH